MRLTIIVEDDAREQLEARYLGGRPSLLSEGDAEWERHAEHVDRLWSLGEELAPQACDQGPHESDPAFVDAARIIEERVAERAKTIADDARVSTFESLGERPRAVAILERRLSRGP